MHDILQDFPIAASRERVFDAVSKPEGLDAWWTLRSRGQPEVGTAYDLDFGPEHQWRAEVTKSDPGAAFELRITTSDSDWAGTVVGFELIPHAIGTQVRFYHRGWRASNEHYRISNHCWAMYLRVLRRHLENGESVPYEQRLSV
jgi:uncharacterized protein YndB with AHSA1/START domain